MACDVERGRGWTRWGLGLIGPMVLLAGCAAGGGGAKAAERGCSRAQIDLGHLYEKGLGVERDTVQALDWYRKASGLTDAIALDAGGLVAENRQQLSDLRAEVGRRTQESQQLRAQLETARRQLDEARGELDRRSTEAETGQRQVESLRRELDRAKAEAGAARDDSKVRALTVQLG